MLASVWEVAAQAPWSFLIGAVIGFVIGTRFQITRRDEPGLRRRRDGRGP